MAIIIKAPKNIPSLFRSPHPPQLCRLLGPREQMPRAALAGQINRAMGELDKTGQPAAHRLFVEFLDTLRITISRAACFRGRKARPEDINGGRVATLKRETLQFAARRLNYGLGHRARENSRQETPQLALARGEQGLFRLVWLNREKKKLRPRVEEAIKRSPYVHGGGSISLTEIIRLMGGPEDAAGCDRETVEAIADVLCLEGVLIPAKTTAGEGRAFIKATPGHFFAEEITVTEGGEAIPVLEWSATCRDWLSKYYSPEELRRGVQSGVITETMILGSKGKKTYVQAADMPFFSQHIRRSIIEGPQGITRGQLFVREEPSKMLRIRYPYLFISERMQTQEEREFFTICLKLAKASEGSAERVLASADLAAKWGGTPYAVAAALTAEIPAREIMGACYEASDDLGISLSPGLNKKIERLVGIVKRIQIAESSLPASLELGQADSIPERIRQLGQITKWKGASFFPLAARLVLNCREEARQKRKAARLEELKYIYAPAAERFGWLAMASGLTEEYFWLNEPEKARETENEIEQTLGIRRVQAELHLMEIVELIRQAIDSYLPGLKGKGRIDCRVKSASRTNKKQAEPGKPHSGSAETIEDFLAVRVVVHETEQIYQALELVRALFTSPEQLIGTTVIAPRRRRLLEAIASGKIKPFKDHIVKPRPSGFEAIFQLVFDYLQLPIEVQITTFGRDRKNKEGVASHWRYRLKQEIEADDRVNKQQKLPEEVFAKTKKGRVNAPA